MTMITLSAEGISKTFNRRTVLNGISFSVSSGGSIAVTGKNGSGKSTLLKVLAGLLTPSSGRVSYALDGVGRPIDALRGRLGFVAPYLQLYDEFSALENIHLISRMRNGRVPDKDRGRHLLEMFGLWPRRDDLVRTFSSGMKQKLKYVVALSDDPAVLLLDEPGANLDTDGLQAVERILDGLRDRVLVLATNDEREAQRCGQRIHLGP